MTDLNKAQKAILFLIMYDSIACSPDEKLTLVKTLTKHTN